MAKPEQDVPADPAGPSPTRVANRSEYNLNGSAGNDEDTIYFHGPRFWGIAAAFVPILSP